MKYTKLFLMVGLLCAPAVAFGACSVNNLTRCLDSVCAINIGANAAARCQYCGSASAGEPTTAGVMKNVTAGSAAKYSISEKELKKAPKDPGQRYVWATEQCLKKVKECTSEDVSDNYDSLIEQSCKAAGIAADMASLAKKATKGKTKSACSNEISACIINDKRCLGDYRNCESDSDFDKYFSECTVAAGGCDEYLADIRSTLTTERDNAIKAADTMLQSIVKAYQDARTAKLAKANGGCKDGSAKRECVEDVCATNMRNHCDDKHAYEKMLAEQLCKFYDTACDRLK